MSALRHHGQARETQSRNSAEKRTVYCFGTNCPTSETPPITAGTKSCPGTVRAKGFNKYRPNLD